MSVIVFHPGAALVKALDDLTVELAFSGHLPENGECLLRRHGLLVGSVLGCQRIVNVQDRQQPGLPGQLVPLQMIRVSGAVKQLVMPACSFRNTLVIASEFHLGQQHLCHGDMGLHDLPLCRRERAAFDGDGLQLLRSQQRMCRPVSGKAFE